VIRVLLADDQALVRGGFRLILESEPDIEVVAEAADGEQAVAGALETRPDLVLMDIRMPVLDGIEAARRLLPRLVGTRVVMLTTFDLDDYVYEALRAGASGFLLKDATAAELVHAVRVVAAGDALLAPSVTRRLIADFARRPRPDPPAPRRTRRPHPQGDRGAPADRPRPVQRRDQRHPGHRRADHQDLHRPHPGQA
jgi:DNA-binding NarL/FixJ family response regulator